MQKTSSPFVIFRHSSFLPSSDSKRWLIVMWGFVFVQNPDSSVLYEQFKSNLVDPSYMRHVVALLLAQQVRFP